MLLQRLPKPPWAISSGITPPTLEISKRCSSQAAGALIELRAAHSRDQPLQFAGFKRKRNMASAALQAVNQAAKLRTLRTVSSTPGM